MVSGVCSIDLAGGHPFAMRLWLDPQRMAARGITGEDVANALRANNVQSAPGQAKGLFTITNITTNTGLQDVDQFRQHGGQARWTAPSCGCATSPTVDLDAERQRQRDETTTNPAFRL